MVKLVYDKGNCIGCPPEMGCLGAGCPYCYEAVMICDDCKQECDELYRDKDTGADLCEDCRNALYEHITIDNVGDYAEDDADA